MIPNTTLQPKKVEAIVQFGSRPYKVTADYRINNWREASKKARIYVWGADAETFFQIPSPPFCSRGDDPLMDKVWDGYNAMEVACMKAGALEAAKLLEMPLAEKQVKFSRNAGCSMCPCSPGFVVDNAGVGWEMFVNVKPVREAVLVG
jgi:hypothetical protein